MAGPSDTPSFRLGKKTILGLVEGSPPTGTGLERAWNGPGSRGLRGKTGVGSEKWEPVSACLPASLGRKGESR